MAPQLDSVKGAIAPVALAVVATLSACQSSSPQPEIAPDEIETTQEISRPVFGEVASPAGGMVKQVALPGPASAVLVTCDQPGFAPFLYTDQGTWIGCQTSEGTQPGAPSPMTEPTLEEVPSPAGGTVPQITLPGPESAVLALCNQEGFTPFLYTDQGTWVGCQGS